MINLAEIEEDVLLICTNVKVVDQASTVSDDKG
jgi:hypothetical protein